jgi:predicted GNAT family acetyltransferase
MHEAVRVRGRAPAPCYTGAMNIVVADAPAEHRYEARDGETLAGLAAYLLTNGNLIVFTHTEVEAGYEGKGVGSQIARAALDGARDRGLRVVPLCPFIKGWIERHPDYADLVHPIPASTATD